MKTIVKLMTPIQKNQYKDCPIYPQISCESSDMFMNYMDYVDDACMVMFSTSQMAHGVFRGFGVGTTPAHEIAHIFGCRHEPCSAIAAGQNCNNPEIPHQQAHSFEYTKREGCWPFDKDVKYEKHTIVFSYINDDRTLHYSNPDVKIENQPTGITAKRDNSKWLRDHACLVANFRDVNAPYSVDLDAFANEDCVGEGLKICTSFDGGCPGVSTWKWYYSPDGVNYTYTSGYDDQCLDWDFPSLGTTDFIRCEATSPCGEVASEFFSVKASCNQPNPYDELLISDNLGATLTVSPNPIFQGNLVFDFKVNEKCNVDYQLLDISGAAIKSKNLGILDKGNYTYRTTIPSKPSRVVLLKLIKGNEIESLKF